LTLFVRPCPEPDRTPWACFMPATLGYTLCWMRMEKGSAKAPAVPAGSERLRASDEEVRILISVIDCLVFDREAVYASSEFTTGRRFYDLCRQYGARTGRELKAQLGSRYSALLLRPNLERGVEFARSVRRFGHEVVITPHPLTVPDWSQPEYLAFWGTVITERCRAAYFNGGWEFSNGCSFEYLVGLKARLPLLDQNNEPIHAGRGAELVRLAIEQLEQEGFAVPDLRRVYDQLTSL
jgi:hypothetical protein